jgi:Spy/CpxP family protein refolding chaperone
MGQPGFARGLVAAAALAVAAVAGAQGGGAGREAGGPIPGGGFAGMGEARWLERHAKELGLDEKTVAEVRSIGEDARGAASRRMDELRAEGRKLTQMLGDELPDEAALAKQAEAVGRVWTAGLEERVRTSVKLRKLLTPEQRKKAAELRKQRPGAQR